MLGAMVPLDILFIKRAGYFPLKGQRLGYRFSQKYGSNFTSLQNLSISSLSNVFLNKCIFASESRERYEDGHLHAPKEGKEEEYLI